MRPLINETRQQIDKKEEKAKLKSHLIGLVFRPREAIDTCIYPESVLRPQKKSQL